jgi:PAS domain S-box-containing protein
MSALGQNAENHELGDALEKLGHEAARLQTVIDTVPSFLWTSLPDGSKEYLNKRWYEYTSLSLEQGKGWGWKVVVHPDDLDRLIREWLALVEARKPGELETRIRRYDGEYRWFLIRVVPQLDAEGNLVRCAAVTATAVNNGLWRSMRNAYGTSCLRVYPVTALSASHPD